MVLDTTLVFPSGEKPSVANLRILRTEEPHSGTHSRSHGSHDKFPGAITPMPAPTKVGNAFAPTTDLSYPACLLFRKRISKLKVTHAFTIRHSWVLILRTCLYIFVKTGPCSILRVLIFEQQKLLIECYTWKETIF